MSELNKEKILLALRCISGEFVKCDECAFFNKRYVFPECREYAGKSALSFIKELTEENENLHTSCTELTRKCASLTEENERLKSVEFTCGFVKPHKVLECPIFDEIERTKTDTVRKMVERLIAEFRKDDRMNYYLRKTLDQVAKEVIGEIE